uniref:Lysine transporter LysE n=1 Tax=Thermosporothrix sp. COM3 TaxID=2490863 RepID=A0A455T1T9_9CHLR|nr:lysine transporter LysE [Thermosporothrix sp. COM3]
MLSFFIQGLFLGLTIAAVVGPMSILCMQRTLARGWLYGFISGIGIATADAVYGSIAGLGLTAISDFLLHYTFWFRLIGGLFLLYLGVKTIFKQITDAIEKELAGGHIRAMLTTFLLTLTNPTTILSFAAIFAGLGAGFDQGNRWGALIIIPGVFLGSLLWWALLTSGISFFRQRLKQRWLFWINRVAGIVLSGFGIAVLVSLFL